VKFAAIADRTDSKEYTVTFMCQQLGVARSGYYAWRKAEPSRHTKDDTTPTAILKTLHAHSRGNAGVRRLRAGLAASGHQVAHKRVHRLMQAADLHGRHPKAWKRTTIGAPDLLARDFTAEHPNEKWCGDIPPTAATTSEDPSDAPEPATTTPSQNRSSPPTRKNSSTPAPGPPSKTSWTAPATGSRTTTTPSADTPPSTT
jgi:HTH-like domain